MLSQSRIYDLHASFTDPIYQYMYTHMCIHTHIYALHEARASQRLSTILQTRVVEVVSGPVVDGTKDAFAGSN